MHVTRNYNQRTYKDCKIVKVKKKFDYVLMMMAKIINLQVSSLMWSRAYSLKKDSPAYLIPKSEVCNLLRHSSYRASPNVFVEIFLWNVR